jgi:exosortase H (IPTLxxWG-CTERM-specific)
MPPLATRDKRVRFVAWFVAIAGLWSFLYSFPYPKGSFADHCLSAHLAMYARVAGALLSLFDPMVHVSGQDIVGRYSIRIVKDCDAMDVTILFASAVLAFPSSWRSRIAGATGGAVAIFAVNLLRICSLYYVGLRLPDAFEFAHRELWPLLLVIGAVGAFMLWASRSHQLKTPTTNIDA